MLRHSTSGKKPTWGVRLTGGSFCTNLKTLISFLPSQFFLKLRKAMVQSTCTCVPAADQCGLSMKLHPLSSKYTQFLLPLRNSTGICIVTWCKPAPGWPLPCTGSAQPHLSEDVSGASICSCLSKCNLVRNKCEFNLKLATRLNNRFLPPDDRSSLSRLILVKVNAHARRLHAELTARLHRDPHNRTRRNCCLTKPHYPT